MAKRKRLFHSEATKRKISNSLRGNQNALGNTNMLGKHHTEEIKLKMSKAHKGQVSWAKGKKFTDEHRRKLSEARRKRVTTEKTKIKMSKSHLGMNHSIKSKMKMSERQKGSKNHNWRGGITPKSIRVRHSIETRLWRESVFARDNYTCQKTGKRGGKLVSHHIKNFAQWPELRFAIDNGITFSEEVHKEFHKKYGKINNNENQLKEFLN